MEPNRVKPHFGTGRRNRSLGGVDEDGFGPFEKPHPRSPCGRRDPRALLVFFGVYTGYAARRVELSGFRLS